MQITLISFRTFSTYSAAVPNKLKYSIDQLLSIYHNIDLKSCEIFDEDPSIIWRKFPTKNANLNKTNAIRDGIKYLSSKSMMMDYLSYFPLHQNELLYPLRTKYSTSIPIEKPSTKTESSQLRTLLPGNAKIAFTDIDKSKRSLIEEDEAASLLTLDSEIESSKYPMKTSEELGAAFHFIPPEYDSVYKANVYERRKVRNKLPPKRSLVKKAKGKK